VDSILARGGSRDALDAFIEFRGRKPDVQALLKLYGIAA
jgi:oligopeptidase A